MRAFIAVVFAIVVVCSIHANAWAASSCADFQISVSAAEHQYVDYSVYADNADIDEAEVSWKVFDHLMDVAGHYLDHCDDRHLEVSYIALNYRRAVHNFNRTDDRSQKAAYVRLMEDGLSILYLDGFARTDRVTYAEFKKQAIDAAKATGVSLKSPETNKLIVQADPTIANCSKRDHPVVMTSALSLNLPPAAMAPNYNQSFSVDVDVDSDGSVGNVFVLPNLSGLPPIATINVAQSIKDDATTQFQNATYQPEVSQCVAVRSMLIGTLEVSGGVVTFSSKSP